MLFNLIQLSLIPLIYLHAVAEATSTIHSQSTPMPMKMPISFRPPSQSYLHPSIQHQQRMNGAHRRYCRLTGCTTPSNEELKHQLYKRVLNLQDRENLNRHRRSNNMLGRWKKTHRSRQIDTAGTPSDSDHDVGIDIVADGSIYLVTVGIGTPLQPFSMILDSGSSDFIVGLEGCLQVDGQNQTTGSGCLGNRFIGPSSSSTFFNTGGVFSSNFGVGSTSGAFVQDNVQIGGMLLINHPFGAATRETSNPFGANVNGIFPLGGQSGSTQNTDTPLQSLFNSGLIQNLIVGVKLGRIGDFNDGEVAFGAADTTKFDPSATSGTLPNLQTNHWEVNIGGLSVDGTTVALSGPRTAILDTGTSNFFANAGDVQAILSLIPGAKFSTTMTTIPCTSEAQVSLVFGNTAFTIDARDLKLNPVDSNNPNGDCVSAIQSGSFTSDSQWLVGQTFLKNVYTIFNVGDNTVTLAKLAT